MTLPNRTAAANPGFLLRNPVRSRTRTDPLTEVRREEAAWPPSSQIEGQPPTTVKAGDVRFIPAGAVHTVRNVGSGNAAELATYVVKRGKPILTLVE